jgi:diketogulonate reductase-like aldo/keto reductase
MEQRRFGYMTRPVAIFGQGTWQLEQQDEASAVAALRIGIDMGMTHIDTAEMYGSGRVEAIVARAIAGRRDRVFLVSKVLPSHASRQGTLAACERSLARLRTDRLDCYLLHWPGPHPLQDTLQAFEQLRRQGKIIAWGVSNFDLPELEEAWSIAGPAAIAQNQVLYHLEQRAIEHRVLPWCEQHGIAVVAYSPFGHGDFPGPRSRRGRLLIEIARAHGATPHQIALRFLTRRASVFAIPKSSRPQHIEENARADELGLSEAELRRIDAAFPLGPPPRHLAML